MSQINLLKQTGQGSGLKQFNPKILVQILIVVAILIGGYYGYLFFALKNTDSKIAKIQIEIAELNKQAISVKDREELFTRQQQIKSLEGLVGGHQYWSQFFPALAKATLKSANYTTLKAGPDNTVTLTVRVPTLEDMDKYMQVFNIDDFNENFSNLKIAGYTKNQTEEAEGVAPVTYIEFRVQMQFNSGIIQKK